MDEMKSIITEMKIPKSMKKVYKKKDLITEMERPKFENRMKESNPEPKIDETKHPKFSNPDNY